MKKVSILIPLHNNEGFISETVNSALAQTWPLKEIIIVDDGSTDSSLSIAKTFESGSVKIISQNNFGASNARNIAFENSSGDYIQFLDSDDILAPDKIEKQLNLIEGGGNQYILSGSFQEFVRTLAKSGPIIEDTGCRNFTNPIDWLVEAAWGKTMFPPVVWLTPRKLIEQAGPWNEKLSYNDDPEFFARVLLRSEGILFCRDAISYYRRGISSSLGSRKDRKARESELESLNLVTKHMLKHEDSTRVRDASAYKYSKLIYSLFPDHPDILSAAEAKLYELGIEGTYDFGTGLTNKLGRIIGWKNAKLIRRRLKKFL